MQVALLEIDGFRGVKNARIHLGEHAVLLGPNNVGKSAILDALALLLGRRGLVRDLWEHDFFGSAPRAQDRITLKATLTGFHPDDLESHPLWAASASHAWWLPKEGRVVFGDRPDGSHLAIQIGFSARFNAEAAEVETQRYFVDSDTDPFRDAVRPVRAEHLGEIGFFLLPSHRTWDRVLSFSSDLFKRTLTADDAKPSAALLQMRDYLRAPEAHLEKAEGFQELVERVERELATYVGASEAKLSFLPTTGDTEGVLKALTPHLIGKAGSTAPEVPMGRQGSGVISLQTILLLLEVGRRRRQQGKSFILAAEEPELHLHPGYHRRLVARLRGVSDQTLVTTHSPEVAAYYHPSEILILRNNAGALGAITLLRQPAVPDKNAMLRLYTVLRSEVCEALMHGSAIVPEGDTEFRWFRGLLRSCATAEGWDGATSEAVGATSLGVLPTQSAHVKETFEQFREIIDGLLPLCDGDDTGREYVKALAGLATPPSRVARLADGLDLEGVLSWVVEPVLADDHAWAVLVSVVPVGARTVEALRGVISQSKTRWDFHDGVLASIASCATAANRVRPFLLGLATIATGAEPPASSGWRASQKIKATDVWVWNRPEEPQGA